MRLEHKVIPFDRKAITEQGKFEGYGSVFDNIDYGLDVVVKGAFDDTLTDWQQKGQWPAMLFSHDMREPIGDYEAMSVDEHGLFVKGETWPDVPKAIQARRMMLGRGPKGLSIGYIATKESYGEQEGRRVRFLEKVDLLEVSPVVFAMNPLASVTSAKSLTQDNALASIRDFEKALCSALDLSARQAKTLLAGGYDALKRDVEGATRDEESLIAAIKNLSEAMKGK